MELFRIHCTTCGASLKVTDPEAIGQILACPRCHSMVLVAPATELSEPTVAEQAGATISTVAAAGPDGASKVVPTEAAPQAANLPVESAAATAAEPAREGLSPAVWATAAVAVLVSSLALLVAWQFIPERPSTATVATVSDVDESLAEVDGDRPAEPAAPEQSDDPPGTPANQREAATAAGDDHGPTSVTAQRPPLDTTGLAHEPPADPSAESHAATADDHQVSSPPEPDTPAADATDAQPPAPTDALTPEELVVDQPDPAAASSDHPIMVTLERVPPHEIDVEERLSQPLRGIAARDVPLRQYLKMISVLTQVPVTVDVEALSDMGLSLDVPVTLQLEETTAEAALEAALARLGLGWTALDHQLVVGRPTSDRLRAVRYAVDDLIGPDPQAGVELAAAIRRLVAPVSWREAGGNASVTVAGGVLTVEQSEAAHHRILVLCEKLRVARGRSLRSRLDPRRFELTSRSAAAAEALAQPVTANFPRPEPLIRIVDYLAEASGVRLSINGVALAEAGLAVDTFAVLSMDGESLGRALERLLAPLELTYRAVDARTIEITTAQAAAATFDLEVYPVRGLAGDWAAGEALLARLRDHLGRSTAGQDPTLHYDVPGACLVVRASQADQRRVEAALGQWRQEREASAMGLPRR